MPAEHVLEHDCTAWRASSQQMANLYSKGVRLSRRGDLRDIEQQLAAHATRRLFTVRSVDGAALAIKNPMFGQESPIWKPRVKFRDYWRLIQDQPDDPEGTHRCSYLPHWLNTSAQSFRGVIANPDTLFEETRLAWLKSRSCALLKSRLEQTAVIKTVSKIICFGLGDICRKPPEWLGRHASARDDDDLEASFVRGAMTQHAIALTFAQVCREVAGCCDVALLAQDPDYTDEARAILTRCGFSIVGEFGAGGFAEIDDASLVFSVFVEAPLKQITADMARPAIIISTGFDVFNDSE
ncbi:hypothetical protein LLEC1_07729 [Akanthomyces lecanii]|uniref:SRR1-like domain-containing protein n=1 Tax=Cordyceps confragosa TaxID=2714763 RepID=A0A179IIJ9_CORDF|nr:hypothetical protein LLEC1_07729 [Akanthomyces lecanii]